MYYVCIHVVTLARVKERLFQGLQTCCARGNMVARASLFLLRSQGESFSEKRKKKIFANKSCNACALACVLSLSLSLTLASCSHCFYDTNASRWIQLRTGSQLWMPLSLISATSSHTRGLDARIFTFVQRRIKVVQILINSERFSRFVIKLCHGWDFSDYTWHLKTCV